MAPLPGIENLLTVDQNTYTNIYDVITKGLLSNPWKLRHKICWDPKSPIINHFQIGFWQDTLQLHRSASNKMDISPDIDPTEIPEF